MEIQLGVNRFEILGITFDTDLEKMLTSNFSDKFSNTKIKINYWDRRNLTPLDKIAVIKPLLLSSLDHLFVSLHNPDDKIFEEMFKLF